MIPGAPRIEQLASAPAVTHVCSALALPPNTPRPELTYELVRAVAWASTSGRTPVSTRTLLDRVMDIDSALQDSTDDHRRRQFLRKQLDDLAAVGDLAALGRGQWVSAIGSIIVIESPAGTSHLLVSGVPVRCFPTSTQHALTLAGPTRAIQGVDDVQSFGLPVISLDDWARLPSQPLEEWTSGIFDAPLGDPTETIGTIRVYQPDLARPHTLQNDRWFSTHRESEGRFLACRKVLGGWTEYSIVELKSGDIIGKRELEPGAVRRLMYGLDNRSGNHVSASVQVTRTSTRIKLRDPLPYSEARILMALGGLLIQDAWTIHGHADAAIRYLGGLHIDIRQGK